MVATFSCYMNKLIEEIRRQENVVNRTKQGNPSLDQESTVGTQILMRWYFAKIVNGTVGKTLNTPTKA